MQLPLWKKISRLRAHSLVHPNHDYLLRHDERELIQEKKKKIIDIESHCASDIMPFPEFK